MADVLTVQGQIQTLSVENQGNTLEVTQTPKEQIALTSAGPQGIPGKGIPTGGTTGQKLVKKSDTDYDLEFVDDSGGGGAGTVNSVNGVSPDGAGNVLLGKDDLGLDQINNTSDVDKPISTAQQDALDSKQDDLGFTPLTDQQVRIRSFLRW